MKFDLNILDILNLPVRILSALALASGFLLLFPAKFLTYLGRSRPSSIGG